MKISLCIISLNEEANLRRCLTSVALVVDEIIVVDSGSTDGTEGVAREFGARWVHQDWLGFVKQKNHVLSLASHDWILSLDADEALSADLFSELLSVKEVRFPDGITGFSFPRCVLYEGKWIRHGDWYPDRLVRLFKNGVAKFAGGKVHERLELDGTVQELEGELEHHSFRDAADHWARCETYAQLWAEMKHEEGRTAHRLDGPIHAAVRWLRGYLFRGGFLDGAQGWQIARFNAREVNLKYRLLRQMNIAARG
jgi:glycosyltransferase involved in cell wall biosynthesis